MASYKLSLFLAMASSSLLFREANSQASDCGPFFLSLTPCLGYITRAESSPTPSCCYGLSSVLKASPVCLCLVLKAGLSQLGFAVNQKLARQLLGACDVQNPLGSSCIVPPTPTAPPSTNPPSSPGNETTPVKGLENGGSGFTPFSVGLVFLFVNAVVGFR